MKRNYFGSCIDIQVNNANPYGANVLAINLKKNYFLFLENYWN